MSTILKVRVVSESADEPISIDEARAHLEAVRYGDSATDDADDSMILGLLKAAREHAERFTGLCMIERTYEGALDEFPTDDDGAIEFPVSPLRAVQSILTGQATGSSSDDTELDPADWLLDTFTQPPRLVPWTTWPIVAATTNGIRVNFTAGYGIGSDDPELPWAARAAILLTLGHLYATREAVSDKAMSEVPLGAQALLRPLRWRLGFA
jgi:uncharacterized phiE125 gp8 family phage protein